MFNNQWQIRQWQLEKKSFVNYIKAVTLSDRVRAIIAELRKDRSN